MFTSLCSSAYGVPENYVASSVLASGKWFRIAITEDGIYRIDYARLKQIGLDNSVKSQDLLQQQWTVIVL